MKNTLLLLLFVFSAQFSHAQNYQCLQSGVKHYFTNSNGYLRGIRIDSTTTSAGNIFYYPYHTPRGRWGNGGVDTLSSNGASWLGGKVAELPDGTFLFDNMHDTVTIKTQAHTGDSWIFYNDTTSLYYVATITQQDTMTVLGSLDSVKTLLITAHNLSGIVVSDPSDSITILLSKNNGFVQVCDLYTFPYHQPDSVYMPGSDYYLDMSIRYIPYPIPPLVSPPLEFPSLNKETIQFKLISFKNPSYKDLYNWHTGEVYEYMTCNGYPEWPSSLCDPASTYFIDTVSAILTGTYASNYSCTGLLATLTSGVLSYPPPLYSVSPTANELSVDTSSILPSQLMPEEYSQRQLIFYQPNDTSVFCGNGLLFSFTQSLIIENFCVLPFEGPYSTHIYKYPFGLIDYYQVSEDSGFLIGDTTLIYASRHDTICGSYHIISLPTLVPDLRSANGITIFPNPANNELTINTTTTLPYTITIHNIIGQEVYSLHTTQQQQTINTSELPAGLYNVTITDESGYRYNNKVVITH